jgi:hypothetical protein
MLSPQASGGIQINATVGEKGFMFLLRSPKKTGLGLVIVHYNEPFKLKKTTGQ